MSVAEFVSAFRLGWAGGGKSRSYNHTVPLRFGENPRKTEKELDIAGCGVI